MIDEKENTISTNMKEKLTLLFSERIISHLKTSEFKTVEKLVNFLVENDVSISKDTIYTYTRYQEKQTIPGLDKACALSKALNFSLDELRDDCFVFDTTVDIINELQDGYTESDTTENEINDLHDEFTESDSTENEMTVQKKLMEYREQYLATSAAFPQFADLTLYKAENVKKAPCLFEFLVTVRNMTDIDVISAVAKTFEDRFFLMYDCIVDKKRFIADCKKRYRAVMLTFIHRHDGEFDGSKEAAEKADEEVTEDFYSMLKKCDGDLNLLDKEIRVLENRLDEKGEIVLLEVETKNAEEDSTQDADIEAEESET